MLIVGRRILTKWLNVSLDFQFTKSKTKMVKSASFTATFCYISEVQLSLQLPAVDQPDQNRLCRLGAPREIHVVILKLS